MIISLGTTGMTVSVKSHVVIACEKLQNVLSSLYYTHKQDVLDIRLSSR